MVGGELVHDDARDRDSVRGRICGSARVAVEFDLKSRRSGWYFDPLVDIEGRALLSPDAPSLNRRPGVILLPACTYFIDEVVYLYPGQTLRGAGVGFDRSGSPVSGTIIVLRGPEARIVGGRAVGTLAAPDVAFYRCGSPAPSDLGHGISYGVDQLAKTAVVIEDVAIVDERPAAEPVVWPALDLIGCYHTRVRRVVFAGRQAAGDEAGEGGEARVGLRFALVARPDADPASYFNRVERCRFSGWQQACRYENTNTLTVESCRFDVPPGGVGFAALFGADFKLVGNQFVGSGQSGVGVLVAGSAVESDHVAPAPHVVANLFHGREAGVRIESLTSRAHFAGTFALNRMQQDAWGLAPPLMSAVTLAQPGGGIAEGDDLLETLRPRVALQDAPVGPPTASSRLGGENLLRQASMIGLGPTTTRGDGGAWAWSTDKAKGIRVERVEAAVGGPRGPGLARAVRFGLGTRRPEEWMTGTLVLEQEVCTWDPSNPEPYLATATRLAGRPVQFSCWVRSNITPRFGDAPRDWSSGVAVGVVMRPNRDLERIMSNRHSGGGAWELLSGVGELSPSEHLPLNPPFAELKPPFLRFVVEIRFDTTMRVPRAFVPQVEICTPCLRTGAFPGPPRVAWLTEDGGDLHGPLVVATGPTHVVSLSIADGLPAEVAAAASSAVVIGDRRLLAGRVWGQGIGAVTPVGGGGRIVAQAPDAQGGVRTLWGLAPALHAGETIRLVTSQIKEGAEAHVTLLLGSPPDGPDGPSRGY